MRNSRSSVLSTTESEAPKSPVPVVGRRIIPREQIDIQNDIGEGEFGVVRHAVYTNDIGQKVLISSIVLNYVKQSSEGFSPLNKRFDHIILSKTIAVAMLSKVHILL